MDIARRVNFDTTGKSLSDNRKWVGCLAPFAKIFCFSEIANHSRIVAILTRQEGRFANVSNVGQVAVDVGSSFDEWSSLRTAKPWGPGTPTLVSRACPQLEDSQADYRVIHRRSADSELTDAPLRPSGRSMGQD